MVASPVGSVTVPLSDVMLRKLLVPMAVTPDGMVSDVTEVHEYMKWLGMDVAPEGSDTPVIPVQSWRTLGPRVVTVLGMVKVPVTPLQLRKQLSSKFVT